MATITDLQALYATAVAAFDAGDYAAAIAAAVKAKLKIALSPDSALGSGQNARSITWRDAGEIDGFIADCRRLAVTATVSTGGPFRQSAVTYARSSGSDSYS